MFGQSIPHGFAGGIATFALRFLGIAGGQRSRPGGFNFCEGAGGAGEYIEKTSLNLELSQNYQVIIGAGNGGDTTFRTNGSQSNTFSFILSGNSGWGANAYGNYRSPGGATLNESAQGSLGNSGGNDWNPPGFFASGGGGGAGGAGEDSAFKDPGNGGAGVSSDITGSAVVRGGGGGGGVVWTISGGYMSTSQVNSSGLGNGGGGRGGGVDYEGDAEYVRRTPTNGTANTGGGGGGKGTTQSATNGGSGVVIIRYPNTLTITVGSGLTFTTTTTGTDKVTTFTAGSDNISFA